jgi:hypothetical protein
VIIGGQNYPSGELSIKKIQKNMSKHKMNKPSLLTVIQNDALIGDKAQDITVFLNSDYSPYKGDELAVPIETFECPLKGENWLDIERITPQKLSLYCGLVDPTPPLKIGAFTLEDLSRVVLGIYLIVPREHQDIATYFGYWAGHEFVYDLREQTPILTGANLLRPRSISEDMAAEIIPSLLRGKLPDLVPKQTEEDKLMRKVNMTRMALHLDQR